MTQPIIISLNKDAPVAMKKEQVVSLSKDGKNIEEITVGLSWESAKPKGLFGKLLGASAAEIDLDASIICYDSDGEIVEYVYFGRQRGAKGAIKHMGDDRVGGLGKEDNEKIHIRLADLPQKIDCLFATVSSFTGQNFENIDSASCRLVDKATGKEDVNINLSAKGRYTGIIMAKIYRYGNGWLIKSIEEPCYSRTVNDLGDTCKDFI